MYGMTYLVHKLLIPFQLQAEYLLNLLQKALKDLYVQFQLSLRLIDHDFIVQYNVHSIAEMCTINTISEKSLGNEFPLQKE